MDLCACSAVEGDKSFNVIPRSSPDLKTTCGSNSCSAVNPSLTNKCGSPNSSYGYQNLCPCEEAGRRCLCKPEGGAAARTKRKILQHCPDPRTHPAWPAFRRVVLVTAAASPFIWALVYIALKFYFKIV